MDQAIAAAEWARYHVDPWSQEDHMEHRCRSFYNVSLNDKIDALEPLAIDPTSADSLRAVTQLEPNLRDGTYLYHSFAVHRMRIVVMS